MGSCVEIEHPIDKASIQFSINHGEESILRLFYFFGKAYSSGKQGAIDIERKKISKETLHFSVLKYLWSKRPSNN